MGKNSHISFYCCNSIIGNRICNRYSTDNDIFFGNLSVSASKWADNTADGSTTAGVQSVSILFDGKNGTLDSVSVPDKYTASFAPNGNSDTVGAIDFEVPTTKGQRVVITYVKVT